MCVCMSLSVSTYIPLCMFVYVCVRVCVCVCVCVTVIHTLESVRIVTLVRLSVSLQLSHHIFYSIATAIYL